MDSRFLASSAVTARSAMQRNRPTRGGLAT
jgi:hypothetical protein